MKSGCKLSLRGLSYMLQYPDAEMRRHLPEVLTAFHQEQAISPEMLFGLSSLAERIQGDDLAAEELYVELFDRGRNTALHLFEHIHGDSRERGPAMLDLIKTYEEAGLLITPDELPDYLPLVLEYASTQPTANAREFINEFGHLLIGLENALVNRSSDYVMVISALIELAGVSRRTASAESTADETVDESWAEPPAFDGCSTKGQIAKDSSQPIRMIRRPQSSGNNTKN